MRESIVTILSQMNRLQKVHSGLILCVFNVTVLIDIACVDGGIDKSTDILVRESSWHMVLCVVPMAAMARVLLLVRRCL